jgi:hypothetical protein
VWFLVRILGSRLVTALLSVYAETLITCKTSWQYKIFSVLIEFIPAQSLTSETGQIGLLLYGGNSGIDEVMCSIEKCYVTRASLYQLNISDIQENCQICLECRSARCWQSCKAVNSSRPRPVKKCKFSSLRQNFHISLLVTVNSINSRQLIEEHDSRRRPC